MADVVNSQSRRFLVLHGWQNRRPREHWEWQLVEQLRRSGEQVLYPQMPSADRPVVQKWIDLLRAELAQLGGGERVVVAHSLGALLWMHASQLLREQEFVTRVLLVAPPAREVLRQPDGDADAVPWSRLSLEAAAVRRAAVSTRIVCSDNDPYCPEGASAIYRDFADDIDLLAGQAHINVDAGYGDWPAVLAWCLDGTAPLRPRASE